MVGPCSLPDHRQPAAIDYLLVSADWALRGGVASRHVACVGEGEMRDYLEGQAYQLGVAHAVRFLGTIWGIFSPPFALNPFFRARRCACACFVGVWVCVPT